MLEFKVPVVMTGLKQTVVKLASHLKHFFLTLCQRKLRKVFMTSVYAYLSHRTITSVSILRLPLNSLMLTGVTPACSLLKIVFVAVILFLRGRTKEI